MAKKKVVDMRPPYCRLLPSKIVEAVEAYAMASAAMFRGTRSDAQAIADITAARQIAIRSTGKSNGLSRATDRHGRGYWLVRVYLPGGKVNIKSAQFSDCAFGSSEKSFAAGEAWRDVTYAEYLLTALPKPVQAVCGTGSALRKAERKAIIDGLLAEHGKCFIVVGVGELAAERAKLLGQTGRTLNAIGHCRTNGFHLGGNRLRAAVVGFVNEITPAIEKQIRAAVMGRQRRWMSCEDVEDAVSSCMLSYSSIDLSETDDGYISCLAGSVVKTMTARHWHTVGKYLRLDRDGCVETRVSRDEEL
jgi:hypothetical protein